ncbi:DNA glycosylase [Trametopsis cervina]|nr:DNA glycosylase [Trametopsis cervina]
MAKRARRVIVDSDSDVAGESDASFTPKANKKKRTVHAKTVQQKKRRVSKRANSETSDTQDDEETVALRQPSDCEAPHPYSRHVIANPAPLQDALLTWYAGVHESRGMPWRKPYDPTFDRDQRAQRAYEVWISEIMLQQTQVVTVIPYYNKWMARFPTINALAASDIEIVNALWKGLGYYSRAARLLSAAKKVVAELDGRLPDNAKDMEAKIPGIGRYSAGAICSIAYNECVPVLDGNVNRLLSRMLALYANPKAKSTLDILWTGAAAMVRRSKRPGDINQALIELGATVCKVRDPDCGSCPLRVWCEAYQREHNNDRTSSAPGGSTEKREVPDIEELCSLCEPLPVGSLVTAFPMKVERKKAREEMDIVNVVEWRHRGALSERWFLLVRRPDGGLLGGLHEFPTLPNVSPTMSASAIVDVPQSLLSDLLAETVPPYGQREGKDRLTRTAESSNVPEALRITKICPAGDVTHIFSHIRKTYRVQWVVLEGGGSTPPSLSPRPSHRSDIGGRQPKSQKRATARAVSTKSTTRTKNKDHKWTQSVPSGSTTDAVVVSGNGEDGDDDTRQAEEPARAMWLLMEDVPEANIGTGVLKVWKQASALWAAGIHTETED